MSEDLTKIREMDEFTRFCRDAGHYTALRVISNWQSLSPRSLAALRKRWKEEDAVFAAKIAAALEKEK